MSALKPTILPLDTALSEQAALDAALAEVTLDIPPHAALLVLTEDAGARTAQRFYADALETGPALASPAAFPWCLANAPCGVASRHFGLTGSNGTWLVEDLGDPSAYEPLADWITGDAVLIVAIRFAPPARVSLWHGVPETLPPATVFADGWRT